MSLIPQTLESLDMDRNREVMWIRQGKGRKDRVIPISERALDWVSKYERDVREKFLLKNPKAEHLFLSQKGKPWSETTCNDRTRLLFISFPFPSWHFFLMPEPPSRVTCRVSNWGHPKFFLLASFLRPFDLLKPWCFASDEDGKPGLFEVAIVSEDFGDVMPFRDNHADTINETPGFIISAFEPFKSLIPQDLIHMNNGPSRGFSNVLNGINCGLPQIFSGRTEGVTELE